MDCTIVPWESLALMVISLTLVNGISSMTGNQVVSTMFDFDTCNHMVRFVLWVTRIEDPGYHLYKSRLRWSMYIW
jgi:hypothetical protein